jgi:hypothetical protein
MDGMVENDKITWSTIISLKWVLCDKPFGVWHIKWNIWDLNGTLGLAPKMEGIFGDLARITTLICCDEP